MVVNMAKQKQTINKYDPQRAKDVVNCVFTYYVFVGRKINSQPRLAQINLLYLKLKQYLVSTIWRWRMTDYNLNTLKLKLPDNVQLQWAF